MLIHTLKRQENLSSTEKQIANYVLKHSEAVTKMSIDEFSEACFTANSSIVRFCQKLGLKGFSDFKINLAMEMNSFIVDAKRVEVDSPLTKETQDEEIPAIFANLYFQSITDTIRALDVREMQTIAKVISKSNKISLLGVGHSALLALDFHFKMRRLGYNTVCDPVVGYSRVTKKKQDNNIAIIISSHANSVQVREWVEGLKRQNTKTILISANMKTPYARQVDHKILIDHEEKRVNKIGAFSTRTAIQYTLDCLYAMVFNLNFDENMVTVEEDTQNVTEQGDYTFSDDF